MLALILLLVFACVTLLVYNFIPVIRLGANQIMNQSLRQAEKHVESLFLEIQAKQVLYATISASVASFMLGLLLTGGSWVMGLIFGVTGYFLPGVYLKLQRKRRREKLNEQIVSAIEMIANALRAGTNFTQALAMIPKEMPAPIAQEIAIVLREMELGVGMDKALLNLVKRVQSEEYDLVVIATNIARETGGNLAEVFERIAKTIRERNEVLGKIRAMTAEGKMQGIFVGLLPLFLGGAMMIMDPAMMKPMFTTTIGYVILGAVVVLEVMGAFFIKKVITIEV